VDARSSRGALIQSLIRDQRGVWVGAALVATLSGLALAVLGNLSLSLMIGVVVLAPLALLFLARQETLLAGCLPLVVIFVDHYQLAGLPLHAPIVAILLGSALLIALFAFQSDARPWHRIPSLGPWIILLVITALAIPRGPLTQTSIYFVTVVLEPFIMFAVGAQVIRNHRDLTRFLAIASGIAVLIALHGIIQGATGVFLFATPRQVDYLGSRYGFHLSGFDVNRAGSFLENPDWNGAYLAFSFFPLLGLFLSAKRPLARLIVGVGAVIVLIGLLFTFTTASWIALCVGVAILLWRVLPRQYVKRALIAIGVGIVAFGVVFGYQLRLLLIHATAQQEMTLRIGVWETALRVIAAHPLLGIGMSQSIYLVAAQPYRVPWQTSVVSHPHDSYLELAAFIGVPALVAFVGLLVVTLRGVARDWRRAAPPVQPLIGGVFVALIVLSVNSLAINAWTLPALAAIAWLMAGAVSSLAQGEAPHAPPCEGAAMSQRRPTALNGRQVNLIRRSAQAARRLGIWAG
jgi:O-antigen ligase